MGHVVARDNPVHFFGRDHLVGAKSVTVLEFTFYKGMSPLLARCGDADAHKCLGTLETPPAPSEQEHKRPTHFTISH